MPDGNSDFQWDELIKESKRVLIEFFQGETADSMAIGKARVATSILSSYTRHEATESARASTAVAIARTIASNPEEFAAYLNASMPQLNVPVPKSATLPAPQED